MSVTHVELLVEDQSTEVALQALLPSILGPVSFRIHSFGGKDLLLRNLELRLRAYSRSLPDGWRIVVLVDRDADDCHQLKARMETSANAAGTLTRTVGGAAGWTVVNRIAAEELEAWFLGDVEALSAAYPGVPKTLGAQAKYRDPDAIRGGTSEALERILQRAGHFRSGLRKIEAARAIATRMDPDRNRSKSFQVFRDVVREIAAT